jgi:hypothetical protein
MRRLQRGKLEVILILLGTSTAEPLSKRGLPPNNYPIFYEIALMKKSNNCHFGAKMLIDL